MRQIRKGVFETNSSSTHSLTIVDSSDYDAWAAGETYFTEWSREGKNFFTEAEVLVKLRESTYFNEDDLEKRGVASCARDYEYFTYDGYWNDNLESYSETHTTPNGDTVVAFGQYGYDN